MDKISEQSEFMKTVQEIKVAEEEYDHLITDAKQKADATLRKAKEQVMKEKTKARENAVAYKNEKLKEGGEEIEGELAKILKKARDEADAVRKKKADKKVTSALVKSLLGEQ